MRKNTALLVSVWAATAVLVLAACGSDRESVDVGSATPDPTSASQPTTPDVAEVEPSRIITEQDLPEARVSLDDAKEKWAAAALTDYTLEVSIGSKLVTLDIVDGEVVSEQQVDSDGGIGDLDLLPRSIEEVFRAVEELVATAENDPSRVAPPDECGYHFNIEFAHQFGYPTYYDNLGHCDDGVGTRIKVVTP